MRTAISATAALLMLGTAASAADMMRPIPYKAAPMAAAPTWTGFYLGVNVGGAFGEDRIDFGVVGAPVFASANNAFHGIIGGGQVGYNWQFSSFVAGFEADFQGSSLKNTLTAPCAPAICAPLGLSATYSQSIPWFGTARARIGYAQDSWLIYVTGGYAYAAVDTNATATAGPLVATFNSHDIRDGWTVGGGIEVGLASNWSVKAEYLYVDLGSAPTTWTFSGVPAINNNSHVTMNVVRAGLNYRF
jgi:outer membrane immunogenic protein